MQILTAILPYLTGGFAIWCVVGVARTAIELWGELRPTPPISADPHPVTIPPAHSPAVQRAA